MLDLRKELTIVANVLADKTGVKIEPGSMWQCNVETKTIYYPRDSWFGISDFGLIIHEASHLRFSYFSKEKFHKSIEKLGKEEEPMLALHNAFEDLRVNRLISNIYKGAGMYLSELYYNQYLDIFEKYNNATTKKWLYWGKDEYSEFIKKNRWVGFIFYWMMYFEQSEVHANSLIQFFQKDVVESIEKSNKLITTQFPKVQTEEDLLKFLAKVVPFFIPLVADEKKDLKEKEKSKSGEKSKKEKEDEEKSKSLAEELIKKIESVLDDIIKEMKKMKAEEGDDDEKGKGKEGESKESTGMRPIDLEGMLGMKIKEVSAKLSARGITDREIEELFAFRRSERVITPEELAKEVSTHLARIRKSVSMLKDSETNRFEGGYESGKLENRKLWKLMSTRKTKIFSRKVVDTNDNKDMAVAILADVSGSMAGGKCHAACVSTTLLTKALEMSGKPVAVYSFNQYFTTHKQWNKKMDYKEMTRIQNIIHDGHGTGDNNDAYAVWKATKELSKRPEKNKILIVLSDGRPCNSCGNSPEGKPYDDYDLVTEARNAEKIAKVYSVGIMDKSVREYYKRNVVVNSVEELAPIMMKFFKENSGKRRK